jgi:hypothetical protein
MSQEGNTGGSISFEKMAQWFVPIVGFVYATGYLIVFRFFARFGLRDTSGDLFKAKYIYVGLMYLVITGLPITLFYIASFSARREHETTKTGQPNDSGPFTLTVIPLLNLALIFSILTLFAPPSFTRPRPLLVPILFLFTFLGPLILALAKSLIKPEHSKSLSTAAWVFSAGPVILVDWYALHGIFRLLAEVFQRALYSYIFAWLIAWIVLRTYLRTDNRARQVPLLLFALCTIVPLYFFSVRAFAAGIYPYISVSNGGGDYSSARLVRLCFDEGSNRSIPQEIFEDNHAAGCTKPLMFIEGTSISIFVADPSDSGGPSEWRKGLGPRVIEIRRDKVISLVYE